MPGAENVREGAYKEGAEAGEGGTYYSDVDFYRGPGCGGGVFVGWVGGI